MSHWAARYEEGYVTANGETVTLIDEYHHALGWRTPEEAMAHWKSRKDLSGPDVREYGNGLEQVDDVDANYDFAQLGISRIWRRVTFVLT